MNDFKIKKSIFESILGFFIGVTLILGALDIKFFRYISWTISNNSFIFYPIFFIGLIALIASIKQMIMPTVFLEASQKGIMLGGKRDLFIEWGKVISISSSNIELPSRQNSTSKVLVKALDIEINDKIALDDLGYSFVSKTKENHFLISHKVLGASIQNVIKKLTVIQNKRDTLL